MTEDPAGAKRVLVIGEALIDVVVTRTGRSERPGGSPANIALGLGRLGTPVDLLTDIGGDERGRRIADWLAESGVALAEGSLAAGRRTSTAVATIAADGHADYDFDVVWDPVAVPSLDVYDWVHVGSIAAFLEPGSSRVAGALAGGQARNVSFDPNIRPQLVGPHDRAVARFETLARFSGLVKLSDEDARWLYPRLHPEQAVEQILTLGARTVAVTLGAAGSLLATSTSSVRVAAPPVRVVDTIGAGDTYMASLIRALLPFGSAVPDRTRMASVGRFAAIAAALTVSREGADLPWRRELAGSIPLRD